MKPEIGAFRLVLRIVVESKKEKILKVKMIV